MTIIKADTWSLFLESQSYTLRVNIDQKNIQDLCHIQIHISSSKIKPRTCMRT